MVAPADSQLDLWLDQTNEGQIALKLIETGKYCVAIAESIDISYDISDKEDTCVIVDSETSEKLKHLEECTSELSSQAKQSANNAAKLAEEHQRQAEDIQREVASLHERENALRFSVEKKRTSLQIIKSQLSHAEKELSGAQRNRDNAESRLREAKKNQELRLGFMPLVGGIIGNFTLPGAGILFGAGAGLGGAGIINELSDAEANAKSDVRKKENQISHLNKDMNSVQHEEQKENGEIQMLSQQIEIKEKEHQTKSNEAKSMIRATNFLHYAAKMWEEFTSQQISKYWGNHTEIHMTKSFVFHDINDVPYYKPIQDTWEDMVIKYILFKYNEPKRE